MGPHNPNSDSDDEDNSSDKSNPEEELDKSELEDLKRRQYLWSCGNSYGYTPLS